MNQSSTTGRRRWPFAIGAVALLASCAELRMQPSDQHLGVPRTAATGPAAEAATPGDIPDPVRELSLPPRPRNGPKLETYSVVVSQVEVAELLFAMARDAKINVDVHPDVKGKVTLNAVNQTLPQILSRLAKQVDIRYEFDGRNLAVTPDSMFVRHYPIDYVNMTRESRSSTSIATQISASGRDPVNGASSGGGAQQMNNNSTTQITNVSNNRMWQTLVANLYGLLNDNPAAAGSSGQSSGGPAGAGAGAAGGAAGAQGAGAASGASGGSSAGGALAGALAAASGGGSAGASGAAAGAAGSATPAGGTPSAGGSGESTAPARVPSIMPNPEVGIISVRATQRQHDRVREYLDKVMNSARRQVMIEATIAEVQLSEQFQQGVNWSRVRLDGTGWAFVQQPAGTLPLGTGVAPGMGPGGLSYNATTSSATGLPGTASITAPPTPSLGVLRYINNTSAFGNISAALSLLQSFGKVKVLSSPKVSVLNNQTAVLKVVDNRVYFTIGVNVTPGTAGAAPVVTYTSTPNTVPVGFVMSVTPQIEEAGLVTMNVRPTISRIIGYVNDPNPALAQTNVVSRIPEIQTREIESIMKVGTGDVAVMGGLMQEAVNDQQDSVPGASGVPLLGNLFKYRNDNSTKTELVIFLRPVVVRDASLQGDYRGQSALVPGPDFFDRPQAPTVPRTWVNESGVPVRTSPR